MIVQNPPQIHRFPTDRLSDPESLNRLFVDSEGKWRLLAVLWDGKGADRLLLPELRAVIEEFGFEGLLSCVVFLGESNIGRLQHEVQRWLSPNNRVSGLDLHASRIAGETPLPLVKLYDPEGLEVLSINGFDTERGLDALTARLDEDFLRTGA